MDYQGDPGLIKCEDLNIKIPSLEQEVGLGPGDPSKSLRFFSEDFRVLEVK